MNFPSLMFTLFFVCATASLNFAYAAERNFPTDDEVENIVRTCAGGYSKSVQGDVAAAIKQWKAKGEISGQASITELGGIISALKGDDAKVTVFKIYADCIKNTLPQYMGGSNNSSIQPSESTPRVAKITSAQAVLNSILVQVSAPKSEDAVVLVNDKDLMPYLKSEQAFSEDLVMYQFEGSPDQLNLQVGKNQVTVKYAEATLPEFEFKYTDKQRQEGQRMYENMQYIEATRNRRNQRLEALR